MNNSKKLNISIQNFDFATNERVNELEQKLEEQYENVCASIFDFKFNEFNDYKEFVDNVYLRIPQRMGWFRKLLFKIIFGV